MDRFVIYHGVAEEVFKAGQKSIQIQVLYLCRQLIIYRFTTVPLPLFIVTALTLANYTLCTVVRKVF